MAAGQASISAKTYVADALVVYVVDDGREHDGQLGDGIGIDPVRVLVQVRCEFAAGHELAHLVHVEIRRNDPLHELGNGHGNI